MTNEPRVIDRVGALAGIVFAVLLVAGNLIPANSPSNADPATWARYLSSSSHRAEVLVGGYMLLVAALALILMLAAMRTRLAGLQGVSAMWGAAAGMAAVAFAAVLIVSAVLSAGIAGDIAFGGAKVPTDGYLVYTFFTVGGAIMAVGGGLAATLGLGAVSIVIIRERGPRWLAILGFIAAVCCIFGAIFVPLAALPIWVLIASIRLLARPSSVETTPSPHPAPAI